MRESLYCIRCGSCLNACPVYKNIGGHAYGTTYGGPIGSVIAPHLQGMNEFSHLSYASSLCGKCTEVCPVNINIHELLLENRHKAVKKNLNGFNENLGWAIWTRAMLSRNLMNSAGTGLKNRLAINCSKIAGACTMINWRLQIDHLTGFGKSATKAKPNHATDHYLFRPNKSAP